MSKPQKKLGVFSFFSGIGLLDLGLHNQGFETLFVDEYHGPFLEAYKHSRAVLGHAPARFGYSNQSIEDFQGALLADLANNVEIVRAEGYLVGFVGGPPCPDFSVGGKNRGQKGENGRLSKTFVDLILACEPDWFLFENVKGLWRTKMHREFFDALKQDLSAKYNLSNRLLNALETGAPQDRDRIFLFGRRSDILSDTQEIDWDSGLKYPGRTAFEKFDWPDTEPFEPNKHKPAPNHLPLELTAQKWFELNEVESHPNGSHFFRPRAGLKRFETVDEGDDSRKSYKRLHRWRYSPTAAYGNNEVHLHPYRARRLSAAEALAIQSAPAQFELPEDMTLSNMFKSIGNAVPVVMAEHVASAVRRSLLDCEALEQSKKLKIA